MSSIYLLYPKESFMTNFKTARKKRYFNNFQLIPICYFVNKTILFQLISKSLFYILITMYLIASDVFWPFGRLVYWFGCQTPKKHFSSFLF